MSNSSASADASPPRLSSLVTHHCGDRGLLAELTDNQAVHALAEAVRTARLDGVVDLVPALETLLVVIDPGRTTPAATAKALRRLDLPRVTGRVGRTVEIPVRYDGPDLGWVARHCELDETEVVRAHTATPWRVGFCGFAPGYAYLIGGDPRLRVPRRGEARVAVPAGSVAIAGPFSAVYPRRSPGGWQLIGSADVTMWDPAAEHPSLVQPGDQVVFRAVRG